MREVEESRLMAALRFSSVYERGDFKYNFFSFLQNNRFHLYPFRLRNIRPKILFAEHFACNMGFTATNIRLLHDLLIEIGGKYRPIVTLASSEINSSSCRSLSTLSPIQRIKDALTRAMLLLFLQSLRRT